jgi:DNA-binding transcriptional MerR regulator
MRDLEALTGESRSTLLYWTTLGLLPPPVKTCPNVAYYDPRVPRIVEAIRHFQRTCRCSLAELRRIAEERCGPEFLASARDRHEDFLLGLPGVRRLDRRGFLEVTGLSEERLEAYLAAGVLFPREPDVFDENDCRAASRIRELEGMGLDLEELSFYPALFRELAEREGALVRRILEARPPAEREDREGWMREMTYPRQYFGGRAFQRVLDRILEERGASREAASRGSGTEEGM